MKNRLAALAGAAVVAASLGLTMGSAAAGASAAPYAAQHGAAAPSHSHNTRTASARWGEHPGSGRADITLVHGVPGPGGFPVDIYVVKNFGAFRELSGVTFGTTADLSSTYPGWVTPGFYIVDLVAHGGNPFQPVLLTHFFLRAGQSKTVAAYLSAADTPQLRVFANDVSSTNGNAGVEVFHLADAPAVGVCADGTVPVTSSFTNGQSAEAVVPAGSYTVTVTTPGSPSRCGTTTLYGPLSANLRANTTTLAYAIGAYPSTFRVAALPVPTGN